MRRVWFGSTLNRNGVKQHKGVLMRHILTLRWPGGKLPVLTNDKTAPASAVRWWLPGMLSPSGLLLSSPPPVCCVCTQAQNNKKGLFPRRAWSLALSRDATLTSPFEDTVSCMCACNFLSLLPAKVVGCCVSTGPRRVLLAVCPPWAPDGAPHPSSRPLCLWTPHAAAICHLPFSNFQDATQSCPVACQREFASLFAVFWRIWPLEDEWRKDPSSCFLYTLPFMSNLAFKKKKWNKRPHRSSRALIGIPTNESSVLWSVQVTDTWFHSRNNWSFSQIINKSF